MKISMIAALARNRVIGTGGEAGGIPWRLPRDSTRFRGYTEGKWMLIGRKTFEEMDGWFTTQTPIVLTRQTGFDHAAPSVESAIELAKAGGAVELVVSGGASVYEAALHFADELVLTFVHADVDGAARFPNYSAAASWIETSRESFPADEENEFGMTFVTLRPLGKK